MGYLGSACKRTRQQKESECVLCLHSRLTPSHGQILLHLPLLGMLTVPEIDLGFAEEGLSRDSEISAGVSGMP